MSTHPSRLAGLSGRVGTAVALAASVVVAATAPAAAATTSGSCSTGGYFALFRLEYVNHGEYHYPEEFSWGISHNDGRLGDKNNVQARVKTVNTGGTDTVHYTWISGDNVEAGGGFHRIPDAVSVPRGRSMYGALEFVFDRPDDSDPRCTGRTKSV
ncbi:hypothetical protein [Jiangella asiatica]|uniref:Uncharacterized protein n=1 Tax=Jiangella asiatica TaxID=2530372 RepID=A0A4R5CIB4_9ACTN|nr:hypothetical protein [Jiangella asiatica]TDD99978.1 hypothetical protein E1269_26920 [Jiangella asiatica]